MEEDIYIYPGHEIHLARTTVGAKEVIIQVNHKDIITGTPPPDSVDYLITDVTQTASISVTAGGNAAVCEYLPGSKTLRVITTSGTGQDTLNVSFLNSNGVNLKKDIIVFVHERLDDWWLGNNSLTVPKDTRVFHCQVSVYGHFDAPDTSSAGTIADITGHAFVKFIQTDPTCFLDSENRGRVQGITVGQSQIQASFAGKTETLPVNVVNFYGDPIDALDPTSIQTANKILERVVVSAAEFRKPKDKFSYGPSAADRFNLLFLGDGYKSNEQVVFDTAVNHVVQEMFSADIHQPYRMCSGNFNVWKAFIASSETGITDQHKASIPGLPNGTGLLQSVDSHYGIYLPKRNSDVLYSTNDLLMSGDPRRYPPELNWAKCIGRHLASLADNTGSAVNGSIWYNDLPISTTGSDFLKDFGLVVILYNVINIYAVATMGNANYGPFILMPLSREAARPAPVLDRGNSANQWKLTPDFPPVPADPKRAFANLNLTTYITTHELTHSFDIGDEYENPGGPYSRNITGFSNLNSFNEVRDGSSTTDIVSKGIKWKANDRMEKSERILSIDSLVVQGDGKFRIEVTLATTNSSRWEKDKKAGTKLYLREFRVKSEINFQEYGGLFFTCKSFYRMPKYSEKMPPATPPNLLAEDPLVIIKEIEIVNLVGNNKMQLDIDPAQLPANISSAADQLLALRQLVTANGYVNGVLYKPKKTIDPGTEKKLVRTEVAAYIDAKKVPLDRTGFDSATDADYPPKELVKTKGKLIGNRFPFKVIGLYEGGDHAHTGVFRPAGNCRMRSNYSLDKTNPEICHVCQYNVVSLLNPAMLEIVENKYPDFS